MIRRVPRGIVIAAALLVVAGLALLVWRGSGGGSPSSLDIGDCFDVPTAGERIEDIRTRTCSGPHAGEVIHRFEAATTGATYPTDADWETLVYPVCDPVFEDYTGTPVGDRLDIGYLYLVPTADRWTAGDRRVTCFIASLDGTPLGRSYRAAP